MPAIVSSQKLSESGGNSRFRERVPHNNMGDSCGICGRLRGYEMCVGLDRLVLLDVRVDALGCNECELALHRSVLHVNTARFDVGINGK